MVRATETWTRGAPTNHFKHMNYPKWVPPEKLRPCISAIHDHIISATDLNELKDKGPLLAGKILYNLVVQYYKLYHLSEEEQRDVYCACVTGDFWDDIPTSWE